ncbi:MAG: preprotein translocase subunit YajC [Candidatus Marinimicrobia bacterium]|nr:preprotein translocase subunit YajC [Candidatus Neomarinimicrobiota bacterium]|tara:strand:+ start:2132 stop:2404 length:273 start_codon:yes stop_codon:yes gene_type:complete
MTEFLPLILQMVVIFGIFYFIIIRPQNKKRDTFQKKLNNIKKGDKVITAGGLKGTVKDFQGKDNEIVILDVGSDTKVNCVRNYIVNVEGK